MIDALLACVMSVGYRPFFDPYPVDGDWLWLIVPLAFGVAIVYKTLSAKRLRDIPLGSLKWAIQILVTMGLSACVIYGLVYLL